MPRTENFEHFTRLDLAILVHVKYVEGELELLGERSLAAQNTHRSHKLSERDGARLGACGGRGLE